MLSHITIVSSVKFFPTISAADLRKLRSGFFDSVIGVGTVMIIKSDFFKILGLSVNFNLSVSSVFKSFIFFSSMSYPVTGKYSEKISARGSQHILVH